MSEFYYAHKEHIDDGATRAHRVRYHIACGFVEPTDSVLDIACGCGYGSEMLGLHAKSVLGVDQHEALITHARDSHGSDNVLFERHDIENEELTGHDVAVSLETFEHILNPTTVIRTLKNARKWIILSVPHIDSVGINPFHFHDYTKKEIIDYFADDTWLLWHSVDQGAHGIYMFRRTKE